MTSTRNIIEIMEKDGNEQNKDEKIKKFKPLLQDEKNINEPDDFKQTPLIYAVRNDLFDYAEELIKAGANLNAQDFSGNTALGLAVQKRWLPGTELLLASGATINLEYPPDGRPIDCYYCLKDCKDGPLTSSALKNLLSINEKVELRREARGINRNAPVVNRSSLTDDIIDEINSRILKCDGTISPSKSSTAHSSDQPEMLTEKRSGCRIM